MQEIWKDIKSYEGLYEVSNLGNVRNKKTNKIKTPTPNNKGYLRVMLSNNKKRKQLYVHRLVAQAFIPNPSDLKQVNHKDENKLNNSVDNLEFCTCQYNVDYSVSKSVYQYDMNKKLIKQWKSIIEASRNLGIADTTICLCCKGKYKQAGGYIWEYAYIRKVVYS